MVERGRNALYRKRGDGTFEDVTDAAGVGGDGRWGAGAFAADYDGDGGRTCSSPASARTSSTATWATARSKRSRRSVGLESPGWNTGAAFFDAEGDGDLDLYVAAYIDATVDEVLTARADAHVAAASNKVAFGPFGLKGAPDRFFRNARRPFVDATAEAA